VVSSVYPDKETAKKATAARNARMEKAAHRRKSTEMHQGEVILKVVRQIFSSGVYGILSPH
jgi:hypothetical protein